MHEVDDRDGESDDESDAYLGTIDSESAVLSSISSNSDEPWIIDLKVGQGLSDLKSIVVPMLRSYQRICTLKLASYL